MRTMSSSSSGKGSGAAELDAPGGSGNIRFSVEAEDALEFGWGLLGLKIRNGSTVGLSPPLGAGLLRNISSSGMPRLTCIFVA